MVIPQLVLGVVWKALWEKLQKEAWTSQEEGGKTMNIDKVLQILLEDCNDDKAENFLRFLSGKLWNLYDEYLMDKIKMAESEIVWNLNIPNAKENQTYSQTVEMPRLASEKLAGVDIVLESITGLDEETHGLLLNVAPDGKSFSIT